MSDRAAILLRYHDLVLQRQDELLDLVQIESGKARRNAPEEVLDVAINSRYYAIHAKSYLSLKISAAARASPAYLNAGALPSPWSSRYHCPLNYPLALAVSDAIPGVNCRQCSCSQTCPETPFTALFAVQLLQDAGLPETCFRLSRDAVILLAPSNCRE